MVIECSLGCLKAWFAAFRTIDINMEDSPFVTYACFAQHNYCEVHKETINKQNINATLEYNRDFQPPNRATSL